MSMVKILPEASHPIMQDTLEDVEKDALDVECP
jgi:hypothetical protein